MTEKTQFQTPLNTKLIGKYIEIIIYYYTTILIGRNLIFRYNNTTFIINILSCTNIRLQVGLIFQFICNSRKVRRLQADNIRTQPKIRGNQPTKYDTKNVATVS